MIVLPFHLATVKKTFFLSLHEILTGLLEWECKAPLSLPHTPCQDYSLKEILKLPSSSSTNLPFSGPNTSWLQWLLLQECWSAVTLYLSVSPDIVVAICPFTSVLWWVQEKSLIFNILIFFLSFKYGKQQLGRSFIIRVETRSSNFYSYDNFVSLSYQSYMVLLNQLGKNSFLLYSLKYFVKE